MKNVSTLSMTDSEEIDEITRHRVELAWSLILDQYFDHTLKASEKEGPGIGIFRLLRTSRASSMESDSSSGDSGKRFNCHYLYAERDTEPWRFLLQSSPHGEHLSSLYDPSRMLMICVQIPLGPQGSETTGNIRLFDITTRQEITESPSPKITDEKSESSLRHRVSTTVE
jgi:hypothetical protein